MNKNLLIEILEGFDNNDIVIIKGPDGGWSNIDYVVREIGSSTIDIVMDTTPIFSGE